MVLLRSLSRQSRAPRGAGGAGGAFPPEPPMLKMYIVMERGGASDKSPKWQTRTKEKKENMPAVDKWARSYSPHSVFVNMGLLSHIIPSPNSQGSPDTQPDCQAQLCLSGIYFPKNMSTQRNTHTGRN